MAVKIRLKRRGRKKLALYDVVVADARAPRDGRFIEKLGIYNPNVNPAAIDINEERALHWVMVGAQPSDTTRSILSRVGVMLKKHLQVGVNKGAITQEQADKRFEDWKKEKDQQLRDSLSSLSQKAQDDYKARLAAEEKVKEARAEAIRKKAKVEEEALVEEIKEAAEGDQEVEEVAEATEEVVESPEASEESAKEEAPAQEEAASEPAEAAPAEEETAAPEGEAGEEKA